MMYDLRERERNAIFKHTRETGHDIEWDEAKETGREKRILVRKWKEAKEIEKKGEEDTMNWNGGLKISKEWKKEEE